MRVEGEIGRKEPCPCGSGRKYKNCCRRRGFKFTKGADGQVAKQDPKPIVRTPDVREIVLPDGKKLRVKS